MVGGIWSSWPGWAATSHGVPMDGLHRRSAAGSLTPLVTACLRQEKSQTAKPLPLQVGVVQVLVGVVRANRGGGVCQPPCSYSVLLHWCLLCHTSCASCAAFCTPFPALAERSACLRARRPCRRLPTHCPLRALCRDRRRSRSYSRSRSRGRRSRSRSRGRYRPRSRTRSGSRERHRHRHYSRSRSTDRRRRSPSAGRRRGQDVQGELPVAMACLFLVS